jgi:hypothetical protein
MPLARIFTHHPERTAALSSQLQQQGYTVEVVNPDQAHLSPADLEIEFEICERADVLDRAAGLADELQADIAVAPGVIQSEPPIVENVPVHTSAVTEMPARELPDAEREFEAAFAAQSELANEDLLMSEIEVPVMERAPLPPVAFADEPSAAAPMLSEIAKPADPVPYLAQLTPFGMPQVDAETQSAALRQENSAEREPVLPGLLEAASAAPAAPSVWQRGASFTAKAVANAKAIAASTVESFREQSQEYQKKAQIRSAEARAAHEARLLDLEQRRAEAQQRATELETAREAAAARLVELVRQRDPGLHEQGLHEQSLNEQSQHQQSLHESLLEKSKTEQSVRKESLPREERKAMPISALPRRTDRPTANDTWWHAAMAVVAKKRRQPMSPQLRAVLTGAAAISALFVVGIVLGSLYPRTPLAKPATQSSNGAQQTGGVTVKASGAPTQASSPAKAAQASETTAAKSQAPGQDKPSPRVEQTRRIAAQQGEEDLGDDVVIRHYQRPVPTEKPKQSGQQAVLKHFSDLDVSPSQR